MKLNAISTVFENFKNSFQNFCLETLMRIESLLGDSQADQMVNQTGKDYEKF